MGLIKDLDFITYLDFFEIRRCISHFFCVLSRIIELSL